MTGMYQYREIMFLGRFILGTRGPRKYVRGRIVSGRPITPPYLRFGNKEKDDIEDLILHHYCISKCWRWLSTDISTIRTGFNSLKPNTCKLLMCLFFTFPSVHQPLPLHPPPPPLHPLPTSLGHFLLDHETIKWKMWAHQTWSACWEGGGGDGADRVKTITIVWSQFK